MRTSLIIKPTLILPSFHSLIRIEHARNDAKLTFRFRMLRLRGFNQAFHHHHHHQGQINHHRPPNYRFNRSNLQIIKPVIFARRSSMADTYEAERREIPQPATAEKTEVREKEEEIPSKKKELPPPPEKPEAGDCCGSGCVRCVWDVYYEELEAYNQLLQDFNKCPK